MNDAVEKRRQGRSDRTPSTASRARGRPADAEKAAAILDAAWGTFLARGVEASTIEAIAATARVSKVTLYRHYADKAALFEAAVLREMERIEAAQASAPPADGSVEPIADRLRGFGRGLLHYLTSGPAVDFYNVVAGELRRHPRLARAFYDLGPGRTRANLVALIEDGVDRGELSGADVPGAADALFGMWQGFTNFQLALDVEAAAIVADIPGRVDRGVTAFLRLYGAEGS